MAGGIEGGLATGLDGIIAAETALSHVDGEKGELIVRGQSLENLVENCGFEGTVRSLWEAHDAAAGSPAQLTKQLGEARHLAWTYVPQMLAASESLTITEGLRVGLSMLPDADTNLPTHVRATGAAPVFVAALIRRAEGKSPVAPTLPVAPIPPVGHVADFMRMIRGGPAGPSEIAAMDAYLTTVAEHGLNASSFAARVIASTEAGVIWATVGGLCALKGPLHGGAPGPVLDMLDAIGTADNARPWLAASMDRGDRLMGFGHRIYRVRDPRADILRSALKTLPGTGRLALAETVEQTARALLAERHPDRTLDTNVEFYTALLLEALGIRREAFTPIFAVGRVAGWTAHALEQEHTARLIRPASRYIGPPLDRAA